MAVAEEAQFNKKFNDIGMALFAKYTAGPSSSEQLMVQTELAANHGKLYKAIVSRIAIQRKSGGPDKSPMTPAQVTRWLDEECEKHDALPDVEAKLRKLLVQRMLFASPDDLPSPIYPSNRPKKTKQHIPRDQISIELSAARVHDDVTRETGYLTSAVKMESSLIDSRETASTASALSRLGINALGDKVNVFLPAIDAPPAGNPGVQEVASSGTHTLFIDGKTVSGEWTVAHLTALDPPHAKVELIPPLGKDNPRQIRDVHVDGIRQYVPPDAPTQVHPHPSASSSYGNVEAYSIIIEDENCQRVFVEQAILHAFVTSTNGVENLLTQYVAEYCNGSPKKTTTVLRCKATADIQEKGIWLFPGGASIQKFKDDVKPNAVLNTFSLNSVAATFSAKVKPNTSSMSVDTTNLPTQSHKWRILSPLVGFNRGKRKAGDTDGDAILKSIPHFWAVLLAAKDEDANCQIITVPYESLGYKHDKRMATLRPGIAYEVGIPYLFNTRLIKAGEFLQIQDTKG